MTKKNFLSLARAVLMIGGTVAVQKGVVSADNLDQIVGGISVLVGVIGGQIAARKAAKHAEIASAVIK